MISITTVWSLVERVLRYALMATQHFSTFCYTFWSVSRVKHRARFGWGAAALSAMIGLVVIAPLLAPFDPYELSSIELRDARLPPAFFDAGTMRYLFGTDGQGRDILSALTHGARSTLLIGLTVTLIAGIIGTALGLAASAGGRLIDTIIMRAADIQLSYPAILVALLLDGVGRTIFAVGSSGLAELHANGSEYETRNVASFVIVIVALSMAYWPYFARTIRAAARVEWSKPYVGAAEAIGLRGFEILARYIWPNVRGQVIVLGTWTLSQAMACEATLSYLGVGLPGNVPSLGVMIRTGQSGLMMGEWWIAGLPTLVLVVLTVTVASIADRWRIILR